ncbi:MAG: O-antigen ligase family protein [Chloroflexota bacterium]|nr:O-antigen ligase family protein [Chloroflexota bacterium]
MNGMMLSGAVRFRRLVGRAPDLFGWRLPLPSARDGALPLVIAGALGTGLGAYTVGISTLESRWLVLLLAAATVPFVVMIVGNLRKLLLAVLLLDVPLQIDTHLNFRTELAELGALGGWNVSVTTLALLGLYALWAMELLARRRHPVRPAIRASLPLGLYVAVAALSILVSYDLELAGVEVFLLGQMFLVYLYVVSTVRTRRDLLFVVALLVAGLAFEGLLMVLLRFGGETIRIPGLMARVDVSTAAQGNAYRLGGTIGGANPAAAYLSLLLGPTLGILLAPLGRWYRRLALLALGFGVLALILTLSRGGWLAFALTASIVGGLAIRRGWLSPSVPFVAAGVAAILVFALQDVVIARLVQDDQGSAHSRIPLMALAFRIIQDHPLLGIGANNFAPVMLDYVTLNFSEYGGDWLFVVHNKYLLVWAETGLVGLLAFVGFLATTLVRGWRGWQLGDPLLSPLALGFTAAIAAHLLHMAVDLFSGRPQVQTLWLCAALIAVIDRLGREERRLGTDDIGADRPAGFAAEAAR